MVVGALSKLNGGGTRKQKSGAMAPQAIARVHTGSTMRSQARARFQQARSTSTETSKASLDALNRDGRQPHGKDERIVAMSTPNNNASDVSVKERPQEAQAKGKGKANDPSAIVNAPGKRSALRPILASPYTMTWPKIAKADGEMLLHSLIDFLVMAAEPQELRTKTKKPKDTIMDLDEQPPTASRPSSSTALPSPSRRVEIVTGINSITRYLESSITSSSQWRGAPQQQRRGLLFVCKDDIEPSGLVSHFPMLVAIYNAASLSTAGVERETKANTMARQADLINLVPLPTGAEASISSAISASASFQHLGESSRQRRARTGAWRRRTSSLLVLSLPSPSSPADVAETGSRSKTNASSATLTALEDLFGKAIRADLHPPALDWLQHALTQRPPPHGILLTNASPDSSGEERGSVRGRDRPDGKVELIVPRVKVLKSSAPIDLARVKAARKARRAKTEANVGTEKTRQTKRDKGTRLASREKKRLPEKDRKGEQGRREQENRSERKE